MKEHFYYKGYFALEDGRVINKRGNFAKLSIHHTGYLVVGTCMDGKVKQFRVHRFVWECFNGPIPEGLVINHKDGNKQNNCIDNLEVVTNKENSQHARKLGLINTAVGEACGSAKLTEKEVLDIIRMHNEGLRNFEIEKITGVHHKHISLIVLKKRWKHLHKD